ncbi:MAG TPA: TlpA disulfide reductase family protein [Actinomycetota bacterium]|nr:TlpA disulfide reductase family protein [Actinomycetota bacterium]
MGALVVVFGLAIFMTRSSKDATEGTSVRQTGTVSVAGRALPPLPERGADTAVGRIAPTVSGADFKGDPVAIENDGRAKVVMFLAHWCPHCQAEVPVVQSWLAQNGAPAGVDLYSVSTGVDPSLPNYPPSQWLAREGWSVPVIADNAGDGTADAFGVNGFPFFVFVNSDGTVAARASGEIPIDQLTSSIRALR